MRVITNSQDAACAACGLGTHAILMENGNVVCSNCLSGMLVTRGTGRTFNPIFGGYEKTYRVNQYCPELPDRRIRSRLWPVMKERRSLSC